MLWVCWHCAWDSLFSRLYLAQSLSPLVCLACLKARFLHLDICLTSQLFQGWVQESSPSFFNCVVDVDDDLARYLIASQKRAAISVSLFGGLYAETIRALEFLMVLTRTTASSAGVLNVTCSKVMSDLIMITTPP